MAFFSTKYHAKLVSMTAKASIDRAGRVVIPKSIRDTLQLLPGDELELEASGDRITLRPSRGHARLRKKGGIWVYNSGEPVNSVDFEKVLDQVRRERDETNLRGSR